MKRILIFLCILAVLGAPAVSATEPLELDRTCSLTLNYHHGENAFSGISVLLYRVADFQADGSYTVTEEFSSYPVKLHDITDQLQWREAAETLTAYIRADGLLPTAETVTDENGHAVFTTQMPGLYLVLDACAETQTERVHFLPFCIFLPTPGEDGVYSYDVQALPKPGSITSHTVYSVVKLWNGNSERPREILVDILKEGHLMDTVTLGVENDWMHTWTAPDTGAVWTVVERNVPDGYAVSITARENVFTIVNTSVAPPDQPEDKPDTGDRAALEVYILAAGLSGVLLLLLGIWYRRTRG